MSQTDKNNSDFTIANIISHGKDLSESKEFINFTVLNTAGEIASINVNRNETVENLQAKIQKQCGIPSNKQIFSCFGESTLLNGNDGMKQTCNDLNEIRVNVNEMTDDLENKYDKAQQRSDELEAKISNNETIAKNFKQKDLAQESETEVCQISNQITKLTKENGELIDPSRICTIKDVLVDYEIDYQLLNGKILEVDKLKYSDCKRKWFADDTEISLENSDLLVCPKTTLYIDSHPNLSTNILNRIVGNNLGSLYLLHVTITHSDYKKLTTSQIGELSLLCVTVMDENGKKVEIDKLLKEKNVRHLTYAFNDDEVTSQTAKKLAELPPFPNLRDFWLRNVQESFDLKTFGEFLIKNSTIEYCSLWFECSDKFYKEIQGAQNDLLPTLPSTCKLIVINH